MKRIRRVTYRRSAAAQESALCSASRRQLSYPCCPESSESRSRRRETM